jgi:hypothetical protein
MEWVKPNAGSDDGAADVRQLIGTVVNPAPAIAAAVTVRTDGEFDLITKLDVPSRSLRLDPVASGGPAGDGRQPAGLVKAFIPQSRRVTAPPGGRNRILVSSSHGHAAPTCRPRLISPQRDARVPQTATGGH